MNHQNETTNGSETMDNPTQDGMMIFRVRNIETGDECEYECCDEGCARMLAAGDLGGDPENWVSV